MLESSCWRRAHSLVSRSAQSSFYLRSRPKPPVAALRPIRIADGQADEMPECRWCAIGRRTGPQPIPVVPAVVCQRRARHDRHRRRNDQCRNLSARVQRRRIGRDDGQRAVTIFFRGENLVVTPLKGSLRPESLFSQRIVCDSVGCSATRLQP